MTDRIVRSRVLSIASGQSDGNRGIHSTLLPLSYSASKTLRQDRRGRGEQFLLGKQNVAAHSEHIFSGDGSPALCFGSVVW
jgi:hypothetical protein